MKKIIITSLLALALVMVPSTHAEETVTCSTSQYGGAVCGVSTSTETISHEVVDTGIADWSIVQIIAFAGITAVAASLLYKASYRWYILG